jgi:crotonobetainyl-CoA:carnitine CoA-transferase CaiB-like acyl-CoA transferase
MFDTMAEYMNVPYLARRYGGKEPSRLGLAHPSIAPYGVFRTQDGEILISIQNEREWRVFCADILGEASLAAELRFGRNTDRVRHRADLDVLIQEAFEREATEHLCKRLDASRIAYGRVSSMADLMSHCSATTARVETPAGPAEVLATPVLVDGARPLLGRAPALGEHDETLRIEFGGNPVRHLSSPRC